MCIYSALLEICLDINQSPALPANLRFNLTRAGDDCHTTTALVQKAVPDADVPADITPEAANAEILRYTDAVQQGRIPHVDLYIVRGRVEAALAAQGPVITLDALERAVPHPIVSTLADIPRDLQAEHPTGYFSSAQEEAQILRLDARLGDPAAALRSKSAAAGSNGRRGEEVAAPLLPDDKHWIELSTREVERQIELLNPLSQHNWLKANTKQTGGGVVDIDELDGTPMATPDGGKSSRGGGGPATGSKRNLAKQLADKAVDRARGGDASPLGAGGGPGSPGGGGADEDDTFMDDHPTPTSSSASGKKRGRRGDDDDGEYRTKAKLSASSAGGSLKGKRKRTGEAVAAAKRAKVEAME